MKVVLYFTGFCWGWRGESPPREPSQSTLYITTNLSDGWEGIWYQITNTFTPCQEQTLTTGQSNPLLIVSPSPVHPPLPPPLQSPGWVELWGRERSAVCTFKVSHVLPCLGDKKKKRRDGGGMENERCGRQWIKSAELDYISFILSGSVPYKSLPSLKGLHGRRIKSNSESISEGGEA